MIRCTRATLSLAATLAASAALSGVVLAKDPPAPAVGSPATYARHLLDQALAAHPEIGAASLVVKPPKADAAVIVASTDEPLGGAADADETQVLGGSEVVAGSAGRITAALRDVSGLPIGALRLVFRPAADAATVQRTTAAVQRFLGLHVLSEANLLDAYPYSPYPIANPSQALVDRTIARHPELIVLGMHVNLRDGTNVMLGSNIGRIGKPADEDDLRVVRAGATNYEVADNGRRYEVELPLNDAHGNRIGALGEVFAYKAGDDKAALNARAVAIRDEMAGAIPSAAAIAAAGSGAVLRLAGSTALPGYKGDFDHFAVDVAGGTLYLAGEDGAALEVFDLHSGALLRSVPGYGVPHTLLVMPARHELLVIDGTKPSRVLDTATLALKRTIRLPAGADSADYDASTGHLWVVTGGKDVPLPYCDLVELDPLSGRIVRSVHFAANHVEALAVEQHGDRLYVNVTDKNRLAVVNKRTGRIIASWKIKEARQNAAIAFDEPHRRLFDVARDPGMLIVLDADRGTTIASFKAPEHADQVTWDAANRRIYVPGGDGTIGVYAQVDANHYRALPRVASRRGAKTAILVPSLGRFYVAASPGETNLGGAVLRFDVIP